MLDEEIPIIWRVVDTFNFVQVLPETVPQKVRETLGVHLRCEVFTRWGPPAEGEFVAELGLILPDGQAAGHQESQTFSIAGEYSFSHVIWKVEARLSTAGTYNWVLRLDGDEVARHPFRVNITRQTQTPEAK